MAIQDYPPKKDPRLAEETAEGPSYIRTEYDDGSAEFDFDPENVQSAIAEGVVNYSDEHYENLADTLDENTLKIIGQEVIDRFTEDKSSRADHMDTITKGLSFLGTKIEETNDPFPGACAAHHPLILESAVKFQAKAANELFNPKGPVKTQVIGKSTPEKESQAQRVRAHMNYQVMHQMEEYFDETENMLFYLPIVGSGFKKTYYDALLDRPTSVFIPVDALVVNYYATNLKSANCYTHVIERYYNDFKKDQVNGLYREIDLSPSRQADAPFSNEIDNIMGYQAPSNDTIYTLLEQYYCLDLEEDPMRHPDGIALPYVITVEKDTGVVLSVRRNWREEDSTYQAICPFTHYKFVPGMGFYGLGYIHLLGNLQMSLTSAMRSLLDSGAFANLQGGFVDKRLRIRSADGPISPGEFKEVEAGGLELEKAIKILPFKEPSSTLMQMYEFVEARAQRFADTTEQVVADSTNYGPVGTTMALLEASTKFFSGVHKRLHKAQKQEFKILASLNFEYLDESETFEVVGSTFEVFKEDYDGRVDVVPVSDPNMSSQAQRLSVAQVVQQGMVQRPDIHDAYEVSKFMYVSLGIDEDLVDKFLPKKEGPVPMDPISDLMTVQKGKPIAAFPGQDHDSHIAVKGAFLQDPQSGAHPFMANLVPLIQANIQEHMVMKFQEMTGAMDPTGAAQSQAAQKLSQNNQKMHQLETSGVDAAKTKLAEAEVLRVINETRKLEAEIEDKHIGRTYDALKLELEKYKVDMQTTMSQAQEANKVQLAKMTEMADLLKEAMKLKAAAESQQATLDTQKEVASQKNEADKAKSDAALKAKKAAKPPKKPKA